MRVPVEPSHGAWQLSQQAGSAGTRICHPHQSARGRPPDPPPSQLTPAPRLQPRAAGAARTVDMDTKWFPFSLPLGGARRPSDACRSRGDGGRRSVPAPSLSFWIHLPPQLFLLKGQTAAGHAKGTGAARGSSPPVAGGRGAAGRSVASARLDAPRPRRGQRPARSDLSPRQSLWFPGLILWLHPVGPSTSRASPGSCGPLPQL